MWGRSLVDSGSALIDFEALLISLPGGHWAGFARDFFAAVCMTLWSFSFDSRLLTVVFPLEVLRRSG